MNVESSIHSVGICGIGQMGAALAVCYKRAGYRVLAWDRNEEKLARIRDTFSSIEAWLETYVGPVLRGGGTINLAYALHTIDQECDMLIDCIAEDMTEKVYLFRQLPGAIRRGAILTTTTSA